MNSQRPVLRIGYVVDPEGGVTKYEPPPPPARLLSREECLDAYRAGIRQTTDALEKMGFRVHYVAEHTASTEFRGYLFDYRIQKPENVAHVGGTALPGSTKGKHGGSIYKLATEIKSEFCLQMIIGKEFSARPLFVELTPDIADPAKHIYDAVMGFLASLSEAGHKLGTSTLGKRPELGNAGPKQLPDWINI